MNFLFTLKLILRGWWRNKLFFAVAVISLSVGLACTNLLLTYFVHDYFIEQNNPDKDRIFALGYVPLSLWFLYCLLFSALLAVCGPRSVRILLR